MRLTTVSDPEAAAQRAADVLARLIVDSQRERGVAHFSLAGGTTPRRAYELLAGRDVDWSAVQLWFGDERCVPPDDPDSNYRMAAESLLALVDLRPEQVHRIPGELGPDPAAAAYSEEIYRHLRAPGPQAGAEQPPAGATLPRLDVALLGLGEDGHTASLFPGAPELNVRGVPCVGVHNAPKPRPLLPGAGHGSRQGGGGGRGTRGTRSPVPGQPAERRERRDDRRRRRRPPELARLRCRKRERRRSSSSVTARRSGARRAATPAAPTYR
jgi:6-phosphogluconolactonase